MKYKSFIFIIKGEKNYKYTDKLILILVSFIFALFYIDEHICASIRLQIDDVISYVPCIIILVHNNFK